MFTAQAARRSRFYLVAVFYLFMILLIWTVPRALLGIETLPRDWRCSPSCFAADADHADFSAVPRGRRSDHASVRLCL